MFIPPNSLARLPMLLRIIEMTCNSRFH